MQGSGIFVEDFVVDLIIGKCMWYCQSLVQVGLCGGFEVQDVQCICVIVVQVQVLQVFVCSVVLCLQVLGVGVGQLLYVSDCVFFLFCFDWLEVVLCEIGFIIDVFSVYGVVDYICKESCIMV